MIRSDFCHPLVTRSKDGNPDGTPLRPPEAFWFFSTSFIASLITEPISWMSVFTLLWIAL